MEISRQEGDEMIDTLEVSMRKEGLRRRTDKRRLIVKLLATLRIKNKRQAYC